MRDNLAGGSCVRRVSSRFARRYSSVLRGYIELLYLNQVAPCLHTVRPVRVEGPLGGGRSIALLVAMSILVLRAEKDHRGQQILVFISNNYEQPCVRATQKHSNEALSP